VVAAATVWLVVVARRRLSHSLAADLPEPRAGSSAATWPEDWQRAAAPPSSAHHPASQGHHGSSQCSVTGCTAWQDARGPVAGGATGTGGNDTSHDTGQSAARSASWRLWRPSGVNLIGLTPSRWDLINGVATATRHNGQQPLATPAHHQAHVHASSIARHPHAQR